MVEHLDDNVSRLEWQMMKMEARATTIGMRVHNECVYVDKNFDDIK